MQPTILVVEDNPNLRELYGEELEDEGYAVLLAEDEASALRQVRLGSPDLVVLDLHIPGSSDIGGLGVLRNVGKERPCLPVIVNSAYQFHDAVTGAQAYVCKSGDLTELKSRIRESLTASPRACLLAA